MSKYNSDDKRRLSIDDDYIELLNDEDDEFEDVYSSSSNDIYSDSSKDVYFNRSRNDDDGVYVNRRSRRDAYDDYYPSKTDSRYPTRETPVVSSRTRVAEADEYYDDEVSDYQSRRTKKRRRRKHRFLSFVAVLLVFSILVVVGAYTLARSMISGVTDGFIKADEIEHFNGGVGLTNENHVKNILLIGCDKEKGGASRSDSMIIVSVNSQTGKATVVSILRDTHVEIPGYRKQKINAAHTYGGANLLVQTIEQNFKIQIDDYATVNFDMFEALVDSLGGVTVDISEAEANHMNEYFKLGQGDNPDTVYSGEGVHLNGAQALCFARIRKIDSDFQRTERQREIITSLVESARDKVASEGIDELISLAQDVAPYVETTLTDDDIMELIVSFSTGVLSSVGEDEGFLISAQLPFEGTWEYSTEWDGSSISIDLEENCDKLYKLLYTDEPVLEEDSEE